VKLDFGSLVGVCPTNEGVAGVIRGRVLAVLAGTVLLGSVVSCGGGERNDAATGLGSSPTTAPGAASSSNAACAGATPAATEVGITDKTITVEVMADTGSPLAPGLATGSLDAVKGWAAMMNEHGGLACRQVEVRTYDSKLSPDEVRNGYTDGCQNAFAMVGTFSVLIADMTPTVQCRDRAGAMTGLPEVPAVVQNPVQNCNPTTFPYQGLGIPCPVTTGVKPVKVSTVLGEFVQQEIGKDAHGLYLVTTVSPGLLQSQMPGFVYMQATQGLRADDTVGTNGFAPQSTFTPFATTIKDKGSKFVVSATQAPDFVLLRKEAASQGDESVKLWMCQATCYDPTFLESGGDSVIGTKVSMPSLPFEEADANAEMKAFVDRVPTKNVFAQTAWVATRMFQQAVEQVVQRDGPNGLTRAKLNQSLGSITSFDANGMIGKVDPSARALPPCQVFVEVTGDGFKRYHPKERGTFACSRLDTIQIDPATAYQG
jgi:hypothetical protein